jgi:AraC-like DNA-binding protein
MAGGRGSLPLSRHPIVSTARDDEAADIISRTLLPSRIAKISEPRSFRLDMNGRRLGRIFVGFNQFAVDTEIDPGRVEDVVIVGLGYGYGCPSCFELDDERVQASGHTATVISPTQRVRIRRPGHAGILGISVSKSVLAERYREITGADAHSPFVFHPSVDLTRGPGRLLRETLLACTTELERQEMDSARSLRWSILEDSLIGAVLNLPGRHIHGLEDDPDQGPAPWVVRRAEDYMAAHVADPITLSDLTTVCGCSRSSLTHAFRSSRGYTPMQFLTGRRLELARERLTFEPGATATEIALDCGFGNHGRFAKAYRDRFGESPSETRARRHGPMRR